MSETRKSATSRRGFFKRTGRIAAASAVAAGAVPHVHAAENNTIQVALVGCGGRGSGAAANALSVPNRPIKLVAMAHQIWAFPQTEESPYQLEWNDLIDAVRKDKPHNEARRGAEASLVSSLGRMAAHTGQVVSYDEILNHEHELAPDVDKLTMDSPAPLRPGSDGKYPAPMPGLLRKREY